MSTYRVSSCVVLLAAVFRTRGAFDWAMDVLPAARAVDAQGDSRLPDGLHHAADGVGRAVRGERRATWVPAPQHDNVLAALRKSERPLTTPELARSMDLPKWIVASAILRLLKAGKVRHSGEFRKGADDFRKCKVWEVVPA